VKITFILPTINMSGGTRVIVMYARELIRMGHSVSIVVLPPPPIPLRDKIRSLIRGQGWPAVPKQPPSHFDESGLNYKLLDRFRAVTDQDVPNADVVIATWWLTAEWVSALSPDKGAKVYFIQHHELFSYVPIERCRATYCMPLHKIVVSSWLKDVMSSDYEDNIVDLVPNSVDHSQFYSEPRGKQRRPTIGFMYSGTPFKGVDLSIKAIGRIRARFPDLRILCFGSERPSPMLPLEDGVEFFLTPSQEKIRVIYSECDALVTASRSEGFNLPAMEAMACRTPVISTRTGWPETAIRSGWNGALVDVDDLDGLTSGIERVLFQSEQDWRKMSDNAYATVADSSWEKSAEMFEQALHHACQRAVRGEIAGGTHFADASSC
jgi:glycosyltransferase involved in cell wall biosynthesis